MGRRIIRGADLQLAGGPGLGEEMPKEAVKLGAVDEPVALPGIPQALISVLERDGKPRQSSRKGG